MNQKLYKKKKKEMLKQVKIFATSCRLPCIGDLPKLLYFTLTRKWFRDKTQI